MEENQSDNNHNQELSQLLREVQKVESKNTGSDQEKPTNERDKQEQKIDVLDLPPRQEVHASRKTGIRLHIIRPYMRFVLVVIVLCGIFTGSYFMWGDAFTDTIKEL